MNTPVNKAQKNALLKVQRLNRLYQHYYFLTEHKRILGAMFMTTPEEETRKRLAINRRLSSVGAQINYTRQQIESIKF